METKRTLDVVETFDTSLYTLEGIYENLKMLSLALRNERDDISQEAAAKVIDLIANNMNLQLDELIGVGEFLHQTLQEERKG